MFQRGRLHEIPGSFAAETSAHEGSWSLLEPPGASRDFLGLPGVSWSLLEPPLRKAPGTGRKI
jgi:hypothetical protein